MVAKNDVTGDAIRSKGLSEQGRENHERIFGKKKTKATDTCLGHTSISFEEKEKKDDEKSDKL